MNIRHNEPFESAQGTQAAWSEWEPLDPGETAALEASDLDMVLAELVAHACRGDGPASMPLRPCEVCQSSIVASVDLAAGVGSLSCGCRELRCEVTTHASQRVEGAVAVALGRWRQRRLAGTA